MPPNPQPLALLTGTQLPSFHSHKLVPTSDKSPESPTTSDRTVGTEGAGGPIVPPYFDGSVNPISNKGTDYALRINTRPSGFSDLPESPTTSDRADETGGAGGVIDPKDFDRSVNPISTMGADYALRTNTSPHGFSDLPESPMISDELKSAALSNEVSNTNSLSPSTTAVFKPSPFHLLLSMIHIHFTGKRINLMADFL